MSLNTSKQSLNPTGKHSLLPKVFQNGLRKGSLATCFTILALAGQQAMADGGSSPGATGGVDNATAPGGTGSTGTLGGSGGGAGTTGGAGGNGNNGAVGGIGGAAPGASGANGGDSVLDGGGAGGGGGAHGSVGAAFPGAVSTGGAGGDGGDAAGVSTADGGGGGAGGWGAVVTGSGDLGTLSDAATGGTGGAGGNATGLGGIGGSGGTGLAFTDTSGVTAVIDAAVTGGAGGAEGTGDLSDGQNGAGGAGITGENLTLTIGTSANVTGGLSGDGATRANAISFTGGTNTLTFNDTTSNLTGNIGNNGTELILEQPTTVDIANSITGTGAVTFAGGGTHNLNAANSYQGDTNIVDDGTVVNANVASALPTQFGRSEVTMEDGTRLNLVDFDQAIASLDGDGVIDLGGNTLTMGYGSGLNTDGNATANFAGTITGPGVGGGTLLKDDTSTQTLSGNVTVNTIDVDGGNLIATGNTAASIVDIASGANLDASDGTLFGTAINLSGPFSGLFLSSDPLTYGYTDLQGNGVINPSIIGLPELEGGNVFTNTGNLRPGDTIAGGPAIGQITTGGNYVEAAQLHTQVNPLTGASDTVRVAPTSLLGFAFLLPSSVAIVTDTTAGGTPVGIGQRFNIIMTNLTTIVGGFGEITDGNNTGPNGVTDANQYFFDRGTGDLVGLGLQDDQGPADYGGDENQTTILTLVTDDATDDAGNYNSRDGGIGGILDLVYGGPAGGPISTAQLLANVDALSPEGYAGMLDYTLQATRAHTRSAAQTSAPKEELRSVRAPRGASGPGSSSSDWELFAGFNYLDVETDNSNSTHDYELRSYGAFLGAKTAISNNLQFGAFLGADEGSVDSSLVRLDTQGYVVGAFARYDQDAFYAAATLSYAEYDFDGRRFALGGAVSIPETSSEAYQVGLEAGYSIYRELAVDITPKISLDYLDAEVDGFTETGGPAALTVGSQDADSLILEAAIDFTYAPEEENWGVVGQLGYQYDFEDSDRKLTANLFGNVFGVTSDGLDEDAFFIGVRGHYDLTDMFTLGLGYRGELRSDSDLLHAMDARVSASF